jgi:hypothetical protein
MELSTTSTVISSLRDSQLVTEFLVDANYQMVLLVVIMSVCCNERKHCSPGPAAPRPRHCPVTPAQLKFIRHRLRLLNLDVVCRTSPWWATLFFPSHTHPTPTSHVVACASPSSSPSTLTTTTSSSHYRARTMPASSTDRVSHPTVPHLPIVVPIVSQHPNLTCCCSCLSNLAIVCPTLYSLTAPSFPSCTCHTPISPAVVYAFLPRHRPHLPASVSFVFIMSSSPPSIPHRMSAPSRPCLPSSALVLASLASSIVIPTAHDTI